MLATLVEERLTEMRRNALENPDKAKRNLSSFY
jgi:hypothetical protein